MDTSKLERKEEERSKVVEADAYAESAKLQTLSPTPQLEQYVAELDSAHICTQIAQLEKDVL
jgi:hypothetical protein